MASTDFRVDFVDDWDELVRLRAGWNHLLEGSRSDTVFLTWEWIEAWREIVGRGLRPFVAVATHSDGSLAGIAPCYLARLRLLKVIPCRTLRVLGDRHTGAEYGDWIAEAGREAEIGAALARGLAGARRRWDCIWMPNVAGWTGVHDRIVTPCRAAGLRVRERPMEFSAARLPPDPAEYWKALSGNLRSSLKRQRRSAEASGVRFETCTSQGELTAFLGALDVLNHRHWSAEGSIGTFRRKPLELAFYRRFTGEALSRGWLRFFALKLGDEFKAVQIGYAYKGSFLQLQEGFDPEGPPGLGNVLRSMVVESCIREGITTYDFLGEHTEHKRRWLADARPGGDLMITNSRPLSAALRRAAVWPTGRFLRDPVAAATRARRRARG